MRADDCSRWDAQLASETTGTPHINDVARRIRYNGAYFEIDVEVNGERGIVPVIWDMLRAHTLLVSQAYYARVYTSRGWANGRQVPGFGPNVILPEAFTPELTPVIFEYFKRSFISWSRDFDGWTEGMANAWMKEAVIHVARAWTPEYVGGVAAASVRASQITGRMALGAAAVPNAAAATRACAGGRCSAAGAATATAKAAPIGFAPGTGGSAFVANRLQHASRHLTEAGILGNWSKATGQRFIEIGTHILEKPIATFDHVLRGGQAVKGFLGRVNGQNVVFFVFKEGQRAGQVATSIVPSAAQLAKWGL